MYDDGIAPPPTFPCFLIACETPASEVSSAAVPCTKERKERRREKSIQPPPMQHSPPVIARFCRLRSIFLVCDFLPDLLARVAIFRQPKKNAITVPFLCVTLGRNAPKNSTANQFPILRSICLGAHSAFLLSRHSFFAYHVLECLQRIHAYCTNAGAAGSAQKWAAHIVWSTKKINTEPA